MSRILSILKGLSIPMSFTFPIQIAIRTRFDITVS
nr:MAG TPA: hypothetical protein [Caudoviricetes sp.]